MPRRSDPERGRRSRSPWELLGLTPDARAEDVIAARRALARIAHPDAGGSVERMQVLNEAADVALASIGDRAGAASHRSTGPRRRTPFSSSSPPPPSGGVRHDHPSFTIEALPAEAFEGLLVVAPALGRVVDDDPPYRLEVAMSAPPAWCRLELVPDAGASTVSITTAGLPGEATPDVDDVRDRWIDALNRLDWTSLEGAPQRPS